jgi:hypothetical protein
MLVLPSTGASRYQNCSIDGGTNPEYFGYTLVDTSSSGKEVVSIYRVIGR